MTSVRALYDAVAVEGIAPPYNTLHLKVYYPAAPEEGDGMGMAQKNMGAVAVKPSATPYPIVIMLAGTNVPAESYSWLARALGEQDIVTVLFTWIKEDMPGFICQSPGIDLANLTPDTFGKAPTGAGLHAIHSVLEKLNGKGLLAGALDTNNVYLGGHSAGGSVALLNNNPEWFPWIQGAFTYAAHAGASTQLGFEDDSMLTLNCERRYLLMAGTQDGVIAESSFRYGDSGASGVADRIERTYEDSIAQNVTFAMIDGANHFTFTNPKDETTGRSFLDWKETNDGDELRTTMANLIVAWMREDAEPALNQPLITTHKSK